MMKFLWSYLFGKQLSAVLDETKALRVNSVKFKIRKVNVLDHLAGSKVLLQTYDTYKTGLEPQGTDSVSEKKIREHYAHVLCAGVVEPKLSHKDDGNGIFVEKMFIDWEMCAKLYNEILVFSYGKKKVRLAMSQGRK